jgi:hypothetical protein
MYGIRYIVTHKTEGTAPEKRWVSILLDDREAAERYFSQHIVSEGGLSEHMQQIWPDSVIDWQIMSLVPAEEIAEALTNLAVALTD